MSEHMRTHGKREAAKGKKKSAVRRRVLIGVGIVAVVLLGIVLLLRSWMRMPSLPTETDLPDDSSFGGHISSSGTGRREGVYTFLIAGRDVASGSTDTMLLVTYDTKGKSIYGLNLPRDTMINTDARSKRLNAVYAYNKGDNPKKRVEAGMKALKKEVQKLTGIRPDYYVLIEWEAIGELVDALGGVQFEVPFNMDYDDPYQNLHIHQKKGLRTLDGNDAMQVIRHRKNNDGSHSEGDVGRLRVQQDFLKAVAKKCLQPSTFLKIPELAKVFMDNVETDLTVGNILALAEQARGMDPENSVIFETAPLSDSVRYNGAAMVTLDGAKLVEVLNKGVNPYLEPIREQDLELLYKTAQGFGVTNGTLADPKLAKVSAPKPKSKPEPEPKPEPKPEMVNPVTGEKIPALVEEGSGTRIPTVVDPATGKLVPAVIDPVTGALSPAGAAKPTPEPGGEVTPPVNLEQPENPVTPPENPEQPGTPITPPENPVTPPEQPEIPVTPEQPVTPPVSPEPPITLPVEPAPTPVPAETPAKPAAPQAA